MVLRAPYVEG